MCVTLQRGQFQLKKRKEKRQIIVNYWFPGKMGPKIARIKRGNASQISVHGPPVIPKKQASNPNSEQTSPHLEAPISIPRELEPLSGPQKEINLEFNPRKNSLSPEIAAALAARKKELLDTGVLFLSVLHRLCPKI